jgi:hypothetical protein
LFLYSGSSLFLLLKGWQVWNKPNIIITTFVSFVRNKDIKGPFITMFGLFIQQPTNLLIKKNSMQHHTYINNQNKLTFYVPISHKKDFLIISSQQNWKHTSKHIVWNGFHFKVFFLVVHPNFVISEMTIHLLLDDTHASMVIDKRLNSLSVLFLGVLKYLSRISTLPLGYCPDWCWHAIGSGKREKYGN